jgi:hypothetical protein
LGWTPVPTAQCSLIKDERRRVGFALLIPIVTAPEFPESPVLVRQANMHSPAARNVAHIDGAES